MSRILLIDDDASLRKMLRLTLLELGHTVIEACNGREGLQACAVTPVDLVLTDIIMPEKEGLETIMEMRRTDPHTRIVAMSGGGRMVGKDYLALARRLGANRVLEKPFTTEEMEAAIAAALDAQL